MSTEQQHLHTAAVSHIRQCFNRINQQVEQAGKEVAAYYFYLVDDFFAAGNAAITYQDLAAFAAKHKKKYKNCTILQAIWDGRCTLYDGKAEIQNASDNWLENQSELYQAAYRSIENLDDDAYQQKRAEYETALIAALQQCDKKACSATVPKTAYCCLRFILMIMMKMTNNRCCTVPPRSSTNRILTKN